MCSQNARQSSLVAYWAWSPSQWSCTSSQYFVQDGGGGETPASEVPLPPSRGSTGSVSRRVPASEGPDGTVVVSALVPQANAPATIATAPNALATAKR